MSSVNATALCCRLVVEPYSEFHGSQRSQAPRPGKNGKNSADERPKCGGIKQLTRFRLQAPVFALYFSATRGVHVRFLAVAFALSRRAVARNWGAFPVWCARDGT